jgi:LPS-assembly protein
MSPDPIGQRMIQALSSRLRHRFFQFFLILLTMVAVHVPPAHGATDADDPHQPWHISADEILYDDQAAQYVARGHVVIAKGSRRLSADSVRFNQRTMLASAIGHVMLTSRQDVLVGSKMDLNLATETGTVYEGSLFLKDSHFHINGQRIEKTGKFTYKAENIRLTSCDGDLPDWKITGSNLSVTIEGFGTITNAALWARSIPVFYSPFMVFPAKTKRQSGLLAPQIGFSDRHGFEWNQPFYWAIDESSDMTLYGDYMEKRGMKTGVQYRYLIDENSQGVIMADGFNDAHIDDGSPKATQLWGYAGDSADRPNSDRYWFRMKHDQKLPGEFTARLDLDIVSDQDYMNEFQSGYNGFLETDNYFINTFGRGLEDYTDPLRLNRLNLTRNWAAYNFTAAAQWYDNVILRRQGGANDTLQQLPLVSFSGARQRLGESPAFFDLKSQYLYFYRQDGSTSHREDIYPRLYLPWRAGNYLSVEPSVGVRETAWQITRFDATQQNQDRQINRQLYDLRLDLSSEIAKVFHSDWGNIDRIQHIIRPQLVYEYLPDENQSQLPYFDETDRINRLNTITFGITNTVTTRRPANAQRARLADGSPPAADYSQVARFLVQQSYDIFEAQESNPAKWITPGRQEPFSPIYGELELSPFPYLSFRADAQWSTYDSGFITRNAGVTVSDIRGDRLYVEHRYTAGASESIYTNGLFQLTSRVAARADYEQNLRDGIQIQSGVGLLYRSQCWSVDLSYIDQSGDRRLGVMVNLFGLGTIGP